MKIGALNVFGNYTSNESKGHKIAKKAAAIGTMAAATGTVLYLSKKGKLNANPEGNKAVEIIKKGLKTVADPILSGLSNLKTKISTMEKLKKIPGAKKAVSTARKIQKAAPEVVSNIKEKSQPALSAIKDFKSKAKDSVLNIFERFTNSAKFNPDKAGAAEKAAETFNNFVK